MSKFFNTANKKLVLGIVLLVVLIGGSYGVYTLYFTPESAEPTETEPTETEPTETEPTETEPTETEPTETEPTETEPTETEPTETEPETLTVVDSEGNEVAVTLPVEKIVCLNPGLIELVFALGGEDKIVGRSEGCTFPAAVSEIPIVAGSSYTPNLEMIFELEPDFIFADTMLAAKPEELESIRNAGIPVVMESASNFTRMPDILGYLGTLLDNSERAEEILGVMEYYEDLVIERVANLTESEKPKVFLEWGSSEWKTFAEGSSTHDIIVKAGGINIAPTDSESSSPTLSPEFVTEQNPEVVLRMASSGSDLSDMQTFRDAMLTRVGLSGTTAVDEDRVYLYDSIVFQGLRYPVGLLYWAKWFNPTLFTDIDPGKVHEELLQEFFGVELEGDYAYPEIYTYVDMTGEIVTLTLPVENVIVTSSGWTDLVVLIGGEDVVMARNDYSTFPPSIVEKPVVGTTSWSINVELVVEMQPDLLLADTLLVNKLECRTQLKNAGIKVIIDDTTNTSRLAEITTALGRMLGKEEKAKEFNDWVDSCLNLVDEGVVIVPEDERPSVYMGSYSGQWTATGPAGETGRMLARAGGNNIITNKTASSQKVSGEFVVESNPDTIFQMTASMSVPTNTTSYEAKRNEIMESTILGVTNAVKNGRVYVFSYRLVQGIHYPIGLLYFAKWLNPDAFESMDPDQMYVDFLQQFFGIDPIGVYVYP